MGQKKKIGFLFFMANQGLQRGACDVKQLEKREANTQKNRHKTKENNFFLKKGDKEEKERLIKFLHRRQSATEDLRRKEEKLKKADNKGKIQKKFFGG